MPPKRPKPDALHRQLAASIRRLAEARGTSLNKLADSAGISRSHLARILSGEASPTVAVLGKLARALKVQVEKLLTS